MLVFISSQMYADGEKCEPIQKMREVGTLLDPSQWRGRYVTCQTFYKSNYPPNLQPR